MKTRREFRLSHTDTGGNRKTVLLVHGIMMSKQVWKNQVEHLSASHRVIALDLYGFGDSTGKFRDSSYEDHAWDIKALLDNKGIKKVHFVGWSLGGAIAIVFATLFPDYLYNLVLVDSTPRLIATEDFPHAISEADATELLSVLEKDFERAIVNFVDMQLPEKNCHHVRELMINITSESDIRVTRTHLISSSARDLRDQLPKIQLTTLLISGELDALCPTEASQYMANTLQHSKLIIMRGLGHAPFLTDPASFNKHLDDFLL